MRRRFDSCDGNPRFKVQAVEELSDLCKSDMCESIDMSVCRLRDQNIFDRLTFARNLQFGVPLARLKSKCSALRVSCDFGCS